MTELVAMLGALMFLVNPLPSRTFQVGVQTPGQTRAARPVGGVQLDIEPRRAGVFVDGEYKGPVDNFRGYYNHLELPAGLHHIEIIEDGYLPMTLEMLIVPNRTFTYRMNLQQGLPVY